MPPTDEHVKALLTEFQKVPHVTHKACPRCKQPVVYLEHHKGVAEGHVYSAAGQDEVAISGYCEWCFDIITQELG